MRTLEQYLRDCAPDVIDFAFRAMPDGDGGRLHLVIHPSDVSGDTIDFLVDGNTLIPLHDTEESSG